MTDGDRAFRRQGLEYRYAYGVAAKPPCTYANGLGKFDIATGEALLWHEPGCIPGEPVMVPRPGAQVLPAPLQATKRSLASLQGRPRPGQGVEAWSLKRLGM